MKIKVSFITLISAFTLVVLGSAIAPARADNYDRNTRDIWRPGISWVEQQRLGQEQRREQEYRRVEEQRRTQERRWLDERRRLQEHKWRNQNNSLPSARTPRNFQ